MKKLENTLNGQPFLCEVKDYGEGNGGEWPRRCGLCFYRDGPQNPKYDCQLIPHKGHKSPKELFGFKPNEVLPVNIDGKEVGHYCPKFLPFDAE